MLKDLVLKNRSYRNFDSSYKISRETLCELIDVARFAASSRNSQPLKFFLSYDKETNSAIFPLTRWAALLDMELPHKGYEPTAYIVICQDHELFERTLSVDVGIAAQTILLAATEMGLGGCMIGAFNRPETSRFIGLPENIEPLLIVALGRPTDKIKLTDLPADGSIDYYRDENDVHYVPKRQVEDMIIKRA